MSRSPLVYCFLLMHPFMQRKRPTRTHHGQGREQFSRCLPPAKREMANLPFHSEERLNWHFVPRMRQGFAAQTDVAR